MAEQIVTLRWAYRGLFLVVALAIFFFKLLPLSALPHDWPSPDLLLCIAFVWVLRRPDYIPAVLVALVYLLEDLLLMRPPGLWALIVLLGTEFLRGRVALLREVHFAVEWALVAAILIGIGLLNRLILAMFMVPQVGLGLTVIQIGMTILAYPAVVVLSSAVFRVRKPATGEVDAWGKRL